MRAARVTGRRGRQTGRVRFWGGIVAVATAFAATVTAGASAPGPAVDAAGTAVRAATAVESAAGETAVLETAVGAETTDEVADEVADETITVDPGSPGRTFSGVGAVSAGASTRLLHDYPQPARSQVLDYLFKPHYGAALDVLKVEIGGETNSTDGAEPSHQRERGQVDCGRGYEWWLMAEATKRNPDLKLAALEWGAPGWIEEFWSDDNIAYVLDWLDCAESHGLDIDYVGGWNEHGYDADWFVRLDRALAARFPGIEIVAADECCRSDLWRVADDLAVDSAFRQAVDVVGVHFACGNRDERRHCASTPTAQGLGKPLWMSEVSAQAHDVGAAPAARSINRMYVDAQLTGYLTWSPVSAWYSNLPIADTGLVLAQWPWSGYYQVGSTVWAFAHTTQFTQPGWRYLDDGSGYLASGASYVSLTAPAKDDFTTVVETLDATQSTSVSFEVAGDLAERPVHVWSSDLGTATQTDDFVPARVVRPRGGRFTARLEPGHVYTFSTTSGQAKGAGHPTADLDEQLALPYTQDFEQTEPGDLAAYFSDLNGSFETVACAAGRTGRCYRQQTSSPPIAWNPAGAMDPTTVVGDPRWPGDYQVATRFLLEEPGQVELIGRVSSHPTTGGTEIGGYHLSVAAGGSWQLSSQDLHQGHRVLAVGDVPIGVGTWHSMALHMKGSTISVTIDGRRRATVHDASQRSGNVGLTVSGWGHAQFDDVRVVPTAPRPRYVPSDEVTATATSATGFSGGYTYDASRAVDDRPDTAWLSAAGQALPQSLTLDLGERRTTHGLTLRPRNGAATAGIITDYTVALSMDGTSYTTVATGSWPLSSATKTVRWMGRAARFVRLTATDAGCGSVAAAAEVRVAEAPLLGGTDDGGEEDEFTYVPQEQLGATASTYHPGFEPTKAIDGDCATMWHSRFDPRVPPPHTLTLDLARTYPVEALVYQPRQDGNHNGFVTRYHLFTSLDGETWAQVGSGTWSSDLTTKVARLAEPREARYVRLEALDGEGGLAAAAEVNVAYTTP